MNTINQSLIRVYNNNEGDVVLAYGNADNCSIQSLDFELLVINQADVEVIAKALLDFNLKDKEGEE